MKFQLIALLMLALSPLYAAAANETKVLSLPEEELLCREKVVAWRATPGDNAYFIAGALEKLAALYSANGRGDDAIAKYKEALSVREKAPKPLATFIAMSQLKLAECLALAHRDAEAEPLILAAYTAQAKVLGDYNPHVQDTKKKLAVCYRNQKKYAPAEILFKELFVTAKKRSDSIACGVAWLDELCYAKQLNELVDIYMRQKKWAEASPLCQKLLAIYQSVSITDQVDTRDSLASVLLTVGICYSKDGQYLLAEPYFQKALELLQSARNHEPSYLAIILTHQANNLAAIAKYEQAEILYKQALSIWQRVNEPGDGDQLNTIEGYIVLLKKTNRINESIKMQAQAAQIKKHFVFTRLPLPVSCMDCWGTVEFGETIRQEKTLIPPN